MLLLCTNSNFINSVVKIIHFLLRQGPYNQPTLKKCVFQKHCFKIFFEKRRNNITKTIELTFSENI